MKIKSISCDGKLITRNNSRVTMLKPNLIELYFLFKNVPSRKNVGPQNELFNSRETDQQLQYAINMIDTLITVRFVGTLEGFLPQYWNVYVVLVFKLQLNCVRLAILW